MGAKPTETLHDRGQSIWLDYITRELMASGTLARYIDELSVTGLTSNPSIFDKAIEGSSDYDDDIRAQSAAGKSGEDLFFGLAIDDIRAAADLFRSTWERTDRVDGWVSLEVSPSLAYDTAATIEAARTIHAQVDRPNVFIKIPGTPEGLPAIEESIANGIPVNVTLLFSVEQYVAQAEAYLRGIERRVADGLDPDVRSVGSLFVSRWDKKVPDSAPDELRDRLGVAVSKAAYKAYRELFSSDRMMRLESYGGRRQRILWASTSTKDPALADTYYVEELTAPGTVNTMPEKTLLAVADHGSIDSSVSADGDDSAEWLAKFAAAGVDPEVVGKELQDEGAAAFVESWESLLSCIAGKSSTLAAAG